MKITKLNFEGEYLFVYSNPEHYFFILRDNEDKALTLYTTDKLTYVESIDHIQIPEDFLDYSNVCFFKPFIESFSGNIIYKGIVTFKSGICKKFHIDNNKLVYMEDVIEIKPKFSLLPCIANITVKAHIQKKNFLYAVGYDNEHEEEVFVIVDTEDMKIKALHSFYSELGDINLTTLSLDTTDNKILLAGNMYEKGTLNVKPYLQILLNLL